jgi:NTE family protein
VADISAEAADFFHRADHCFGRTAFMMSGSGSPLYFSGRRHTLLEQGLLPNVLSGSAAAFVGSPVSTRSGPTC